MLAHLLKNYVNQIQNSNQEIEFDNHHGSVLSFGDGMVQIQVEPQENCAWFHCCIANIPEEGREKLYQSLLISQAFGKLTQGTHFSLDIKNKKILLCQSIALQDLTQDAFNLTLNNFLEACLLWQTTLSKSTQ